MGVAAGLMVLGSVVVAAHPLDKGIVTNFPGVSAESAEEVSPESGSEQESDGLADLGIRSGATSLQAADAETSSYTRVTEWFTSANGERCHAWLYLPKAKTLVLDGTFPVVIMAHGFGQHKDLGLQRYAELFAEHGTAVLAFDYRACGLSEGLPRNYLSPQRHVEDWVAAIDYIATRGEELRLDQSRIGLWGTSFSGGHTLVAASKRSVCCVVSQAPLLKSVNLMDEAKDSSRGLMGTARILAAAMTDEARCAMGMSPAYVKIASGHRDELALMVMSKEEYDIYQRLQPDEKGGGWINLAPSRVMWEMLLYSPIDHMDRVGCPVLFIAGERDSLAPMETIFSAFQLAQHGSLLSRDANHFELYFGDHFEHVTQKTVKFFHDNFLHLLSTSG